MTIPEQDHEIERSKAARNRVRAALAERDIDDVRDFLGYVHEQRLRRGALESFRDYERKLREEGLHYQIETARHRGEDVYERAAQHGFSRGEVDVYLVGEQMHDFDVVSYREDLEFFDGLDAEYEDREPWIKLHTSAIIENRKLRNRAVKKGELSDQHELISAVDQRITEVAIALGQLADDVTALRETVCAVCESVERIEHNQNKKRGWFS